ncbi:hypothetical protein Ddye_025968 [Dipteronia dyeriana]|uniref:SWIM-type domain-containing protein n=1 Tax=Dipteronia dyeriana TaxID=168575 RepID=A0AAD9TLS3_9ROSI|nr:hypothetical protein Ddye_025968 [Dipteronia dyeriana]
MLLESLRGKMLKRMYKLLEDPCKWSPNLPPLVAKKLAERQDEGRFVTVLCASDTEYEVKKESKCFIVNLITHNCDCGLWEVSGIPCKHAMAIITAKRLSSKDYVEAYLTKFAYLRTYSYVIHPIQFQPQWLEVQHPESYLPRRKGSLASLKKMKRGHEEPPKHKRSGPGKCTQCGEYGHNIRICKGCEGAASKKRML